jgi:demethylmenaquinone methyltransferase/2-methoxy-6-polyprenyl-1,4-benzoquinol methylase
LRAERRRAGYWPLRHNLRVPLRTAFDSPAHKRTHVRRLFATIADRYDLITRVLSYGQDRRWKARLIAEARVAPADRALDLACGTGDLTFALAGAGAEVVGLDITLRMLQLACAKGDGSRQPPPHGPRAAFLCGDMVALPFEADRFDLVTTGYGLRNVPDLDLAIREIARVLRPGGRLLSLDFNRPASRAVRVVYLAYLTAAGSALGWLLHRDPDTYRYIPESIRRYPGAEGVADRLAAAGFGDVRVVPLLGGLMTLHTARRGEKTRGGAPPPGGTA